MRSMGDDDMKTAVRLEQLKDRVDHAEYSVDVEKVADAIVRRILVSPTETGGGTPRGSMPQARA